VDEARRAAVEAAARLIVAAIGDDAAGAVDVLTAPGCDVQQVAIEAAVIAARALRQAEGSDKGAYDAAGRLLAAARAW
jgi:hypothetical protein